MPRSRKDYRFPIVSPCMIRTAGRGLDLSETTEKKSYPRRHTKDHEDTRRKTVREPEPVPAPETPSMSPVSPSNDPPRRGGGGGPACLKPLRVIHKGQKKKSTKEHEGRRRATKNTEVIHNGHPGTGRSRDYVPGVGSRHCWRARISLLWKRGSGAAGGSRPPDGNARYTSTTGHWKRAAGAAPS